MGRSLKTRRQSIAGGRYRESRRRWQIASSTNESNVLKIQKKPGLQGPIDDAFLSRFIIVKPTVKSSAAAVDEWCMRELDHAVEHWRRQFRGDAIVKEDTDLTQEDFESANLICFGTPESNRYCNAVPIDSSIDAQGDRVETAGYSFSVE